MEYTVSSALSLISKIHSLTADYLQGKLQNKDLPNLASSHGNILYCLTLTDKMSMKELASRINRDKSTTTVLVRKLEGANLVKIERSVTDRRQKFIALTENGREWTDLTLRLSQDLLGECYKGFSDEEKTTLLNLLLRIKNNMEQTVKAN